MSEKDTPQDLPHVARRVQKERTEAAASRQISIFCDLVLRKDLPRQMIQHVMDRLVSWKLIDASEVSDEVFSVFAAYRDLIIQAKNRAAILTPSSQLAFAEEPWNYEKLEAKYEQDELAAFPRAAELQKKFGSNTTFLCRIQAGSFYLRLVETGDGQRKVFREVASQRSVSAIDEDIHHAPSILPHIEVIPFEQEKFGLLIDWVEGYVPTTNEEKARCILEAESLLNVEVGTNTYDLYPGNFILTDAKDHKVFYVDGHMSEAIVKYGLDTEGIDRRRAIFDASKRQMM